MPLITSGVYYSDIPIYTTASIYYVDSNTIVLSDPTGSNYTKLVPTIDLNGNDVLQIKSVNIETGNDAPIQQLEVNSILSGINPTATAPGAATFGIGNIANNTGSFVEGVGNLATGFAAHAAGFNTTASGYAAFSTGVETDADGTGSFTAGSGSWARGHSSVAIGRGTIASGSNSHAEGLSTIAYGIASHAEGRETQAIGLFSHAEGEQTQAIGDTSHAEGTDTKAFGVSSHAEGELTEARGAASHAEGLGTITQGDYQLTIGQYNISSSAQSAFIIGNGVDANNRSNLLFASGSQVQITGSLSVSGSITSVNTFVQGGNSFGTTALLGTNDNQDLQLETSGSVRIHISNSGNVGIGTTSPISTLSVAFGNINIGTGYGIGGNYLGAYDPFIRYNHTGISGTQSSSFGHTTAYMLSDSGGPNDISFYAGAVTQPEIMRIVGSSGFVGIGTGAPTEKLHIDGNLLVTGKITAQEFYTEFVSASIIYESGSTKFGNSLDDIHTFTGSLNLTGSLSVKGPLYDNLGTAGTPDQILFTTSTGLEWRDNIANSAQDLIITGKNVGLTTISKGTPLYFTSSGTSGNIVGILPADAGNPNRMPAGGVAGEQITAGNEGDVYIYGFISGVDTSAFSSGDDVFVAVGGGYTNIKPTGSALIQKLGNIEKVNSSNGSGVIQGPSWYNDLPNWEIGRVMVGRSTGQPVTSSLVYLDEANGRLGLSTTTPSASLHVQGNFQISTGSLYTYGQNTDIDSGSFRTVITIPTSSYRAAFFDYVLTSGSNARAGTISSVWQGTSVEYADTPTNDIGNTTGVNLLVSMSGANIGLFASSSNDNWSMKALARMI
jgi:hypothetical protein